MSLTTACRPHLDNLRGQGDWVGGCDAGYTLVGKIWQPTTTEKPSDASWKICINDLERCQHSSSKDGNALDLAHCGAQPKSLPDILPEFLSNQRHPVHAEHTQRGRRIKELCQNLDVGWDEEDASSLYRGQERG